MAAWIKMSVGMELGLGPGDFVLDGNPASLPKGGAEPPIFGPCLFWPNGWMDEAGTWHGEFVLDGDPLPLLKKGAQPPNFRPMFIVAKWLDGSRWHLPWR